MKKIPLIGSNKFTLIDDEDFDEVSGYRWKYNSLYARAFLYCYAKKGIIVISMSRLIMRCPPLLTVDHINLDKLDNRKENLRICEFRENLYNRPKRIDGITSQYKGVSFFKATGKYIAVVYKTEDGFCRRHDLGYHDTELEAALAYNRKAKELFGEFARLNEI